MDGNILLVDDDVSILLLVSDVLEENGMNVVTARSGEEAVRLMEGQSFDLILLDIMMKGLSGLDVCRKIRSRVSCPILFLSAKDSVKDIVAGLDLGADDYLCKPFALIEVAARLEALLRRANGQVSNELRHGQVTLNPGNLVATLAGDPLPLKPKEFALLELLMRNVGRVLPRKLIEEKLYTWDEDVSSNTIEVHVHHLRRKLGSDFIRTVHGIGYTLGNP